MSSLTGSSTAPLATVRLEGKSSKLQGHVCVCCLRACCISPTAAVPTPRLSVLYSRSPRVGQLRFFSDALFMSARLDAMEQQELLLLFQSEAAAGVMLLHQHVSPLTADLADCSVSGMLQIIKNSPSEGTPVCKETRGRCQHAAQQHRALNPVGCGAGQSCCSPMCWQPSPSFKRSLVLCGDSC